MKLLQESSQEKRSQQQVGEKSIKKPLSVKLITSSSKENDMRLERTTKHSPKNVLRKAKENKSSSLAPLPKSPKGLKIRLKRKNITQEDIATTRIVKRGRKEKEDIISVPKEETRSPGTLRKTSTTANIEETIDEYDEKCFICKEGGDGHDKVYFCYFLSKP